MEYGNEKMAWLGYVIYLSVQVPENRTQGVCGVALLLILPGQSESIIIKTLIAEWIT